MSTVKATTPDTYQLNMMRQTADTFTRLAAMRGISSSIDIIDGKYVANGTVCGTSVHGLYDWLEQELHDTRYPASHD